MASASSRRIWIQTPLGFGSGVPLLLTGATLTARLDDAGVGLEALGFLALLHLPYNLKIFWAPFLDRFRLPWLGRRRDWMLATQIVLMVAIAAMGLLDAAASPAALVVLALGVAFVSASLDVVVDAYRTDVLSGNEVGKGAATYVTGYRTAMIAAGGGALVLADLVSWRAAYLCMASLMAVGIAATLCAPEPGDARPPASLREAVFEPLYDFFRRRWALLALAIVVLYKLGEGLVSHMITPFLLGLDFSKTEIGLVQKTLGLAATIGGCALGGILADRIGVLRALLLFGLMQALANVGYVALALVGKSHAVLFGAVAVDNVCNGCGIAALMAFMMTLCNRRFSATQYALLASASTVLGRLLGAASGYLVGAVGWAGFYVVSIVLAAPALVLVTWYRRADGQ